MTLQGWTQMSSSRQEVLKGQVALIHLAKPFGANSQALNLRAHNLLEILKMFSRNSKVSFQWEARVRNRQRDNRLGE
jgi:hypothetical protein